VNVLHMSNSGADAETAPRTSLRDHTRLDGAVRSGLFWTSAAKWAVQAIAWASTILVVRLLAPRDYGVVGMAVVFLSALQPLCEWGIASAIVRDRSLTRFQISQLNGFALVLGILGALVIAAAAAPIARFFHEPELRRVIPVIGLTFVLSGVRIVPGALLVREMRFRSLAVIETSEALCMSMITLALAAITHSFWALVAGQLGGRAIGTLTAVLLSPVRISLPRSATAIGSSLRFGGWVAASTLAWFAYSNADRAIVGRVMGEATLGAYAIAMTFAVMPVEKIGQLYQRVAEAVIAQIQGDRKSVARYLLGITESVAAIAFPLSVGLALVADQFVDVILGEQWQPAIVPLQLLALASVSRSLDPLLAQILIVTGHARENARSMAIAVVILPVGFVLVALAGWGVASVAAVWLVGHPAIVISRQLRIVLKVTGASAGAYARALWPATSSTVLMAIAVIGMRALTADWTSTAVALSATIATGAVAYAAALYGLHRARVGAAWAFARGRASATA
jgi:PST family polysaccharide transporter